MSNIDIQQDYRPEKILVIIRVFIDCIFLGKNFWSFFVFNNR